MAKRPEQGTQEDEISRSKWAVTLEVHSFSCPACSFEFFYRHALEPDEFPRYCPGCGFDNDPAHRNCEENKYDMDKVLNATTNAAKREDL